MTPLRYAITLLVAWLAAAFVWVVVRELVDLPRGVAVVGFLALVAVFFVGLARAAGDEPGPAA